MLVPEEGPGGTLKLEFSTESYEADDPPAIGQPMTTMPGEYPILGRFRATGVATAQGPDGDPIPFPSARTFWLVDVKGQHRFIPTMSGERID